MRGVYLIRHKPSGRCYVGGSRDVPLRWKSHRWLLERDRHDLRVLQEDWNRDGPDAFEWELVESVPHYGNAVPYCWAVDFAEQRWIDRFLSESVPLYNRNLRNVSASRMPDERQFNITLRRDPIAERKGAG